MLKAPIRRSLAAMIVMISASCSADRDSVDASRLTLRREIQPDSVVLDYRSRNMLIFAALTKDKETWPDTVWVWAFFTSSQTGEEASWSDEPIAVVPAFDSTGAAAISAVGPFHWATNVNAPRSGFRARVFVAPTRDSASVRSSVRDRTGSTMHRVVVRGSDQGATSR